MTGGEKSVYRIRNELSDTLEVSDNVQKKKKKQEKFDTLMLVMW